MMIRTRSWVALTAGGYAAVAAAWLVTDLTIADTPNPVPASSVAASDDVPTPVPVGSQPNGRQRPGSFGSGALLAQAFVRGLDRDHDGRVSREELITAVEGFFQSLHKGTDGALGQEDLAGALRVLFRYPITTRALPSDTASARLAHAFAQYADRDGDGRITLSQFLATTLALFQACDQDHDGALDENEIATGIVRLLSAPPELRLR
jgi:Ca2+-binding EF-hand superfamily protein